jgi:hypothetical protein
MAYLVGGKTFRTKGDVTTAATAIRDSVPIGGEITSADRAFMLELLGHHEEAGDKIRDGVVRLFTMRNAYGTVSFAVERSDGTTDDFSIGTCVKGLQKA